MRLIIPMPSLRAVTVFLAVVLLTAGNISFGEDIDPRPAAPARLAHEALVLDIVRAGERLVAVGERGHVLLSADGASWEQARFVPASATLTSVAFAGGRLWAVGHDTTIIHSRDLGRTWSLQHFEPEWEQPLLDVHFFDGANGLAVGAYGVMLRTRDGGRTWEQRMMADAVVSESIDWEEAAAAAETFEDEEFEPDLWGDEELYDAALDFDRGCFEFMECHLNALLDLGEGRLMIAAERGYGYRSTDGGETWDAFRFPYPGSMFGLLPAGNDGIIAFGLRGHVQLSRDFGDSWEILDSGIESTLMGGTLDPAGNPVMVGAGATILIYDVRQSRFRVSEDRLGSAYAAVLFGNGRTILLAGEDGVRHE